MERQKYVWRKVGIRRLLHSQLTPPTPDQHSPPESRVCLPSGPPNLSMHTTSPGGCMWRRRRSTYTIHIQETGRCREVRPTPRVKEAIVDPFRGLRCGDVQCLTSVDTRTLATGDRWRCAGAGVASPTPLLARPLGSPHRRNSNGGDRPTALSNRFCVIFPGEDLKRRCAF